MKINSNLLDKISIIYAMIPLFIFLLGFLKLPIAIFSSFILFCVIGLFFKTLKNSFLNFDKKFLFLIVTLAFLWCLLSGIGGVFYQSTDWHMRNAIFRDLINYSYPVYYDNGSALVYYIANFLPGALFGKVALFLNFSKETAFLVGNFFNFIYCFAGLVLIFLQTCFYSKANKLKDFWVILIVIFFSGLDILLHRFNLPNFPHIERHYGLQYSSNTTLLFWVYNQAIIPWVLTLLFIKKSRYVQNYAILATLMLFCSPLAFIGFSFYLFWSAFCNLVKRLKTKYFLKYLKRIFNLQNILTLLFLFPIVYLYISSNEAASLEELNIPYYRFVLFPAYLFIFLEAGVYLLLLIDKFSKNLIYLFTVIQLVLIAPFIRIGTECDFVMRMSIPALFVLMIFIIQFLKDRKTSKTQKTIMTILLLFGLVTPCVEICRTSCSLSTTRRRYLHMRAGRSRWP